MSLLPEYLDHFRPVARPTSRTPKNKGHEGTPLLEGYKPSWPEKSYFGKSLLWGFLPRIVCTLLIQNIEQVQANFETVGLSSLTTWHQTTA
jgi:hypothetical protein